MGAVGTAIKSSHFGANNMTAFEPMGGPHPMASPFTKLMPRRPEDGRSIGFF
jgi:hypothetical protein